MAQPDGTFQVLFTGESGQQYQFQCSTNLVDWEPAGVIVNTNGASLLQDNTAGRPRRFYRTIFVR